MAFGAIRAGDPARPHSKEPDTPPETTMAILITRSTQPVASDRWAGLARQVAAWPLGLMTYWHRRATIKALRELDDHSLRDIGLTRADIEDAMRDKASLGLWLQV